MKIIIRETGQEVTLGSGGGAGTAINASIYTISDPKSLGLKQHTDKLLIRCNAGEIQDGDEAILFRNVNNRMRGEDGTVARYHGWVKPRQNFPLTLEFVANSGNYDIWAITTDTELASSFGEYERMRQESDIDTVKNLSLMKKCGVAIFRDNIRITDYLKFRIVYSENSDMYFIARW